MCPIMENPDLVFQETGYSQGPAHSRPAECGSRQAIQAGSDHPHRVVLPSRGLPVYMHQVAPTPNRPFVARFNNQLLLFVSPVPDCIAWTMDGLGYFGRMWTPVHVNVLYVTPAHMRSDASHSLLVGLFFKQQFGSNRVIFLF